MVDLTTRPELARLDGLINSVLDHTNDFTGLRDILNEYPVLQATLIDGVEPEDEDELARLAILAYEEIIRNYATRIPIQWDEDGYVDDTQAWELAEQIYDAVSDYNDLQIMAQIADWIIEGDWREDQIPNVDELVKEWLEFVELYSEDTDPEWE